MIIRYYNSREGPTNPLTEFTWSFYSTILSKTPLYWRPRIFVFSMLSLLLSLLWKCHEGRSQGGKVPNHNCNKYLEVIHMKTNYQLNAQYDQNHQVSIKTGNALKNNHWIHISQSIIWELPVSDSPKCPNLRLLKQNIYYWGMRNVHVQCFHRWFILTHIHTKVWKTLFSTVKALASVLK